MGRERTERAGGELEWPSAERAKLWVKVVCRRSASVFSHRVVFDSLQPHGL